MKCSKQREWRDATRIPDEKKKAHVRTWVV
jgi:hypothetical protein